MHKKLCGKTMEECNEAGHKFRLKKGEGDGICDFCELEGEEVQFVCTKCEDGDGDYCGEACFLKSHQKLCGKTMAECKKAGHRMRSKKLRKA